MRLGIVILVLVGLCGGASAANEPASAVVVIPQQAVPLPRPRPVIGPPPWPEPKTFREAAGDDFKSDEVTSAASDCRQRLEKVAVIVAMPRLIGPGACGGGDMIEISAVRLTGTAQIAVKPAPLIRCSMAESLAEWIRNEAVPRVAKAGPALRSVETYDDFNCRGRNRIKGARMSEHGRGNAVDIRSFTLADNRVMHLTDMTASKDLREGLRDSVCTRFTTVLGPGSDGYHEEHIHLDLAERSNGYRICQWDVREPRKPEELIAAAEMADKPTPMQFSDPVPATASRRKRQ